MDNPVEMELDRRYREDTQPPNPTSMDKAMISISRALPFTIIGLCVLMIVVALVIGLFQCWKSQSDRKVYSDESMLELEAYASFTASNRRRARSKSSTSPSK